MPNHNRRKATEVMRHHGIRVAGPIFCDPTQFDCGSDGSTAPGACVVFVVVPILLVVACGTLLLAERRSGHVIMFLGGLAALGMPIIHRNNGFTAAVAKSPGGLFFIWTLMALGVTGGLAMILSARGLWNLRSRKT